MNVFTILTTALWLWAAVEMFRRGDVRSWWMLALLLGPLGALAYLLVRVVPEWAPAPRPSQGPRIPLALAEIEVERLDNAMAWRDLAEARRFRGKTAEALEAARRAADKDPRDPHIAWELARCLLAAGLAEEAIAPLTRVLERDRSFAGGEALFAHAQSLAATGRHQEALEAYRELGARSSRSELVFALAEAEAAAGYAEPARVAFRRVISEGKLVPRYLAREVRPWMRRAEKRLAELGPG